MCTMRSRPVGIPARRRPLDRIVADRDHQIGIREADALGVVGRHARPWRPPAGGRTAMAPLAMNVVTTGIRSPLGERRQLLRGLAANHAVAGQDQRRGAAWLITSAARASDGRSGDGRRGLSGASGSPSASAPRDVFRELQMAGARLFLLRALERLAHRLGHHRAGLDARVPLRERPEDVDDVDELVRLLVQQIARELARDRHHRRAVEVGVGEPGGEVGRAGAERGQAHAGLAGEPAPHVGHERRALLVADRDEAGRTTGPARR